MECTRRVRTPHRPDPRRPHRRPARHRHRPGLRGVPHDRLHVARPVRPRPRPRTLPAVEYPAGAVPRKVAGTGDLTWHGARILVGRGRTGEWVRVEEAAGDLIVRYAEYPVRRVPLANLGRGGML